MASETWPPTNGLFTPTVARNDVVLPLHESCIIDAPASVIWDVLRDSSRYAEWNSFVPAVKIDSQPDGSDSKMLQKGTQWTMSVRMDPAKPKSLSPTALEVSDVSTPEAPSQYIPETMLQDPVFTADLSTVYRIAWKLRGGLVGRGLRSERFHEIIVLDENRCEVRNWECMGGILARTVKWMYGSALPLRTKEWTEDLKRECERQAKQGSKS